MHVSLLYCQLLGMNCATPTDYVFSFRGFCQRGGVTDIHSDGWGLSFYQGKGVRTFVDTEAASTWPIASFLSHSYPIKTLNMISHIRYATRGGVVNLDNVHPFQREMWGIHWCFAHNGDVCHYLQPSKMENTMPGWEMPLANTCTTLLEIQTRKQSFVPCSMP